MTQTIAGRLAAGRFTFAEFYGSLVLRIVPALLVLVAAIAHEACALPDVCERPN